MFYRWVSRSLLCALAVCSVTVAGSLRAEPRSSTSALLPGVRLQLKQLERTTGDTVTLRAELINDSASVVYINNKFAHDGYNRFSALSLVDLENRTEYGPLRSAGQGYLCSDLPIELEPGQRIPVWARFPAPPSSVRKVSVMIDSFEALDDVAIQN